MVARPLDGSTETMSAGSQLHAHLILERRRFGAVALAVVALIALLRLRGSCETWLSIGSELVVQLAIMAGWWLLVGRHQLLAARHAKANQQLILVGALLAIVPWCLQIVMRLLGQGTGLELIAMSSFAWTTLLAALCVQRRRALGTSVVCSGFLTLLATCSSDQSVALLLALLWGGLCLWWLASSNWERAQRCQVSTVIENRWQRPIIVLVGSMVFVLSAWSVAGRFPPAGRLPWEIAPTSGGTSTNDEFARSGVGDGDALVAAREHAASFGAVDSDLMLESKEASLFDLYSDTFGEPFRKQDTERTVALAPQQSEVAQPANMAQSDGASASLTTQRRSGASSQSMANRASDALLFWIGRPDSHLALERFSEFDGIQWKPSPTTADLRDTPSRTVNGASVGGRTWFSVTASGWDQTDQSPPFRGALPEAVKIARLRSPRIPTIAGMQSWHIHQVDDGSFFHVDKNDNLTMPGRKSVPEYTIVRYVNREIDLQSLTQIAEHSSQGRPKGVDRPTRGQQLAAKTVQGLIDSRMATPWDKASDALALLRNEFRLDRSVDTSASSDPLADFFTERVGSDLMFATAAACMLRELGYENPFGYRLCRATRESPGLVEGTGCLRRRYPCLGGSRFRFRAVGSHGTISWLSAARLSHQLAVWVALARLETGRGVNVINRHAGFRVLATGVFV